MTEVRGLLASPIGYFIGLSLGALGGGGSILAVPVLVYAAGQDPRAATTTSLLIVGLAALQAMRRHLQAGNVRVATGSVFAAVGIGGSIVGNRLNRDVDPDVLLLAFAGLMLMAAQRMWASTRSVALAPPPPSAARAARRRPEIDDGSTRPGGPGVAVKVLVAGTGVGFLTGFFGVGGGFVIVPILVLALGLPMREAVGTSLLVIAANSAISLIQRLGGDGIDWATTIAFTAAALLGALHGTRLAERLPARSLGRWFVALLVVVALYVATRAGLALR